MNVPQPVEPGEVVERGKALDRGKVIITDRFRTAKAAVNQNNATRGLFLFVILPTILAIIYYYVFAADIYVTESKFSVNVEGHSGGAGAAAGLGALVSGLSMGSSITEAMLVKEYILSPTIVDQLEKEIKLKDMFNNRNADMLTRIPSDLPREEFAQRYQNMVDIVLDEASGITTLRVKAFTPQDSKLLSIKIIDLTENFVNQMSKRVQDDSIAFSKRELKQAENEAIDIGKQITDFRNKNQNFDPTMTTKSILTISGKLEEKLAETRADIANFRNYMQADNPKITSLEAQANSLEQQINSQNNRLAGQNGSTLATTAQEYEVLKARMEFAEKKYQVALTAYESAQAEATKKSKYLLRIVEPAAPEIAEEPRRMRGVFTVFLGCLIGYMLMSLIIASIKDHIRP